MPPDSKPSLNTISSESHSYWAVARHGREAAASPPTVAPARNRSAHRRERDAPVRVARSSIRPTEGTEGALPKPMGVLLRKLDRHGTAWRGGRNWRSRGYDESVKDE